MMYFNKDRIIYGILSIITVNFVNIYMCLYTQGCMFLTMKTGIRVSGSSWHCPAVVHILLNWSTSICLHRWSKICPLLSLTVVSLKVLLEGLSFSQFTFIHLARSFKNTIYNTTATLMTYTCITHVIPPRTMICLHWVILRHASMRSGHGWWLTVSN